MRPADEDLGSSAGLSDLDDIDLDAGALGEDLVADLLVRGQEGVGILGIRADLHGDAAGARVDAGHLAGEDLVLVGGKLVIDHAALGLANALDDDLLGRARGDAAEFLGVHRDADLHAGLRFLVIFLRLGLRHLDRGVFYLLHDVGDDEHLHLLRVLVDLDDRVVGGVGMLAAEGRQDGLVYLVEHILAGNTLLPFNILNSAEELGVHGEITSVQN